MQLRPYQSQIINAARDLIRKHNAGCVVAPTAAGKTVIFTTIAKMAAAKGKRVLILVDQIRLLSQTSKTLTSNHVHNCIIHDQDKIITAPVILSTVQTFSNLHPKGIDASLMIIDECHISRYDAYVLLMKERGCKVIGFTATPWRADKGKAMHKVYEHFAQPSKTHELIEDGWLAKPRYFTTQLDLSGLELKGKDFTQESQDKVFASTQSLIDGIKQYSLGKALVFVNRIAKAEEVALALTDAGIPAKAIHGKMKQHEIDHHIALLQCGRISALVNAMLCKYGFDLPAINTVVDFTATTSLAAHHQKIGRGARLAPGKDLFHVLDFGGNLMRLGLWEEDINWHDHFYATAKPSNGVAVKECPKCYAYNTTSARTCRECGHEFTSGEAPPKPVQEVDTQLVEFKSGRLHDHDVSGMDVPTLIKFAEARTYKRSWIHHQLCNRANPMQELTAYFQHVGKPEPAKSAAATFNRIMGRA